MQYTSKLSAFLLAAFTLAGLVSLSGCSKSPEAKCQEMIGIDSGKLETGSGEEMALKGCLALANQLPDAFNREYEAWKTKHDKAEK